MEDQAQKTEALKKAYADIILNTAKEAAARTMASETKALRFHHDLSNIKDEALRMILRLKHMMDAKTSEAEMTSLGQQKRIEELDSKLNETEGVIVDLRAEISKARERLEEAKLQSNKPFENDHMHHLQETSYDKNLDYVTGDPKLASTIIGSKELELYKNGYTHRIRANMRNLVDEKSITQDKSAEDICTKEKSINNMDEKNSAKCSPLSIDTEDTDTNTDTNNINGSKALSKNSIVRYARSNPKLSRFYHHQSVNSNTEPEKVNSYENSLGKDAKSPENSEQSAGTLRRSVRKRKLRCYDDISTLLKARATLSRCKKYSSNDSDENQHKSKSVAEINQMIVPMSSSPANASKVEKHEVAAKESAEVSTCNSNTGLLKYTFSRKRKRDLSSKSDHNYSSNGNNSLIQKKGENEKPNVIEDAYNDTQSMVEVACQLISLSGQR